jgi:hypothetical protein
MEAATLQQDETDIRRLLGAIEQPLNQRVRQALLDGARERWRAAGFRFRGLGVQISRARHFGEMTDQANLRIREQTDMKKIILALAFLYPAAVLAQGTSTPAAPPTIGGKPLVVVGSKKSAEGKKEAAKPLSPAQKLQACQDIDDATKERLNCYDAIYSPQPKPKAAAAKSVTECRFQKEEDERLTCYNGFADKIPQLPR